VQVRLKQNREYKIWTEISEVSGELAILCNEETPVLQVISVVKKLSNNEPNMNLG
jgi:hypothetical protein